MSEPPQKLPSTPKEMLLCKGPKEHTLKKSKAHFHCDVQGGNRGMKDLCYFFGTLATEFLFWTLILMIILRAWECFVPVRTWSICSLVLIRVRRGRTTKSWRTKVEKKEINKKWCLGGSVCRCSTVSACFQPETTWHWYMPSCWVCTHPHTCTHLRGRAGSTTYY